MSKTVIILLVIVSHSFTTAQNHQNAPLLERFRADSARDAKNISEIYNALPHNMEKEAKYLDSVISQIRREQKPGYEAIWGEYPMASYVSLRTRYQHLQQSEKDARGVVNDIEASNRRLSQRIRSGQLADLATYEKERKVRKAQIERLQSVKRSIVMMSKRIARKAFWYVRNMAQSDAPVMSTLVTQYLAISSRDSLQKLEAQWQKDLRQLAINNESLEREQDEIEKNLATLKTQLTDLQQNKNNLEKERFALKIQNDSIATKQRQKEIQLREDIKKWEFRMLSLHQRFALQRQLTADSLWAERNELETLRHDSLAPLTKEIERQKDRLNIMETNEKEIKSQLRKEIEWKELRKGIGILSAIFLPIIGFLYYKKRRFEIISKKRTEVANTMLRQTNEQLLQKKELLETLVQELHHRTKNNLQQISSLLFLHAREVHDLEAKEVLNEARGRIEALGIVHRLLYKNPQQRPTFIHLTDYTTELVEHLASSTKTRQEDFTTQYDMQSMAIEMDIATQVGLILNELLHNCFKHAFPEAQGRPSIAISAQVKNDTLFLAVQDNGPGIPDVSVIEKSTSFGLKFVRKMVEKSGGAFHFSSTNAGSRFEVEMPMAPQQYFTG